MAVVGIVLSLLSALCALFAVDAVRSWLARLGEHAASAMRSGGPSAGATVHPPAAQAWVVAPAPAVSVIPEPYATDLARYFAAVDQHFARVESEARGLASRVAELEANVAMLVVLRGAEMRDARRATGWIIASAALAVLAVLAQAAA